MTRWWWVRHGPTHATGFTGWRDLPADLSDHARIARLNAFLPQKALLISSDLVRASATADVLAAGRTRLPAHPGLREFNFGLWDGMPFNDVTASDPELSRIFWEAPGDIAPPEGESWHQLAARVAPVVSAFTAEHAGHDIVAVAHIGVIMTQIAMASGATPAEVLSHKIDNLSVTTLRHGPDGWQLGQINHTP
ncbi:histidine phosphatase family protein [Rhodophyticola sp. CCM32]|nr:histidine phosphatase family protein [Rhodophyticola sp. CCM32]QBY02593.1 histidine phosphatase family protein [Rhodophyticola sp. CCM32]